MIQGGGRTSLIRVFTRRRGLTVGQISRNGMGQVESRSTVVPSPTKISLILWTPKGQFRPASELRDFFKTIF